MSNMFRYEELWWHYAEGPLSIAQLALSQPPTNINLLYLHHQLATALHMMMSFVMKVQTPIETLFNGMVCSIVEAFQYFQKEKTYVTIILKLLLCSHISILFFKKQSYT